MGILTGVAAVAQWQFIISIVGEMTQILGIEVFLTKQTVEKRKAQQK